MAESQETIPSFSKPAKMPRLRKAKYSLAEEDLLQQEMEKNILVLQDKHSKNVNNMEKNRIWTEITNKINALWVAHRTSKEVRDKWRNTKSMAKAAFTEFRTETNKTGGGPAPKQPSAQLEKVISLFQDSARLVCSR